MGGKKLEVQIAEQEAVIAKLEAEIKAMESDPTYARRHAELTSAFRMAENAKQDAHEHFMRVKGQVEQHHGLYLGKSWNDMGPSFLAAVAKFVGANDQFAAMAASENATQHEHRFLNVAYTIAGRIVSSDTGVQAAKRKLNEAAELANKYRKEIGDLEHEVEHVKWKLRHEKRELNELQEKLKAKQVKQEVKTKVVALDPNREERDREIRRKLKALAEGELEFHYNGVTVNKKDEAS